jgi:hypothetical protein
LDEIEDRTARVARDAVNALVAVSTANHTSTRLLIRAQVLTLDRRLYPRPVKAAEDDGVAQVQGAGHEIEAFRVERTAAGDPDGRCPAAVHPDSPSLSLRRWAPAPADRAWRVPGPR